MEGVTNDGWQYLDDNLIDACYRAPPEWIYLMRRITIAAKYVRVVTQGDVLMEEDTEEESESEEDDLD